MPREALFQVGDFAILRVTALEPIGAFLDWGHEKDLLLPFAEQLREPRLGQELVVRIYEDNNGRPAASMRLERFLEKTAPAELYRPGEKVDLLVFAETDLGYKAVINRRHLGVLYKNEVFRDLRYGDELPGYIGKRREDGKIDLLLQPPGNLGSADLGQQILDILKENQGFLPLTDKTAPEEIYRLFGVSKKKYKMALGGLYKSRRIRIADDGIYLA